MSTIVVGVDGSEGSIRALQFALDEARLRDAQLKAVNAWHIPAIVYEAPYAVSTVDPRDFEKAARQRLEETLAASGASDSGVEVAAIVVEGPPADVLCEVAKDADLLVVGSRGLGGFRGLLLGSVSRQCAHQAPCPVLIVPAEKEEPGKAG